MEWLVLASIAGVAALLVGLPWTRPVEAPTAASRELEERRAMLLADLSELDRDLAEGRISAEDRLEGRRALAPELRAVTEQLRAYGQPTGPTG